MTNEKELMQSIDTFLSENKDAMLADLKTLIDQPSVRGEAAPGAPYGTDVNAALEKALALSLIHILLQKRIRQVMHPSPMPNTSLPSRVKGLVT